ncbi:MAG: AHH domain-containing protein [Alphaproteobacteria bacterium]|nr:AHH domain-containing protein [Alphaproteobacteria bacterium]
MQLAAQAGFDFDSAANGVALSFAQHRGLNIFHHNRYNAAVRAKLDYMLSKNPNMTPQEAADFLNRYTQTVRDSLLRTESTPMTEWRELPSKVGQFWEADVAGDLGDALPVALASILEKLAEYHWAIQGHVTVMLEASIDTGRLTAAVVADNGQGAATAVMGVPYDFRAYRTSGMTRMRRLRTQPYLMRLLKQCVTRSARRSSPFFNERAGSQCPTLIHYDSS